MNRIAVTWKQLAELCKHQSGIGMCHHPFQRCKEDPICWHHKDCPVWMRHKKISYAKPPTKETP